MEHMNPRRFGNNLNDFFSKFVRKLQFHSHDIYLLQMLEVFEDERK